IHLLRMVRPHRRSYMPGSTPCVSMKGAATRLVVNVREGAFKSRAFKSRAMASPILLAPPAGDHSPAQNLWLKPRRLTAGVETLRLAAG
ncbi:MAG: hypothetical protein ACRDHP_11280, partial [Ktedonobacterales bacterium]